MPDFKPEHYLAAARIAYPDGNWHLFGGTPVDSVEDMTIEFGLNDDYRALREALDKKGISLHWLDCGWIIDYPDTALTKAARDALEGFEPTKESTEQLMNAVVALVEAGVV